ncbi:MAG: prepilin-type N-terminal cleavage/methylation domain-containing protein [Candidatus Nealsonbacteria bacterium]|nr:prepilin-type N-terminal cleavage/methylation domain-containing protein [Candidatus Nealsonbacteria bacterium]
MREARQPTNPARGGVTLLELLIVITVLMMLVGVALPTMKPALEARQIREAARSLNVYLGSARSAAMVTGRPCGVMIQRLDVEPLCSMVLSQVQVPPPYAGDTLDARAVVKREGMANGIATVSVKLSSFNATLVNPGDLVQFNHQGPMYTITGGGDPNLTLQVDVSRGLQLPWPENGEESDPVPYKIFRSPMKSYATPMQLPGNAAIDLQFSGSEDHFLGAGLGGPIYIMFSPDGSVYRAYHDGNVHYVTEPIYLLVGRRDRIPEPTGSELTDEVLPNYQDTRNFWLTLSPQTGLVTTVEVAAGPNNTTGIPADVQDSRSLAREAQSIGGR